MSAKVLLISANRCVTPDPVFPLGLVHLNAALRQAGHETLLLDVLADDEPLDKVLHGFRPDLVGISLRNIDTVLIRKPETFFDALRSICETVRREHPCPVVLGGSGFSLYPKPLMALSGADFGIQGEGEQSFPALISALRERSDYAAIPGLVYRRQDEIVSQGPAFSAQEIQITAGDHPRRLVDYYLEKGGMLNLQTQRGCAHTCCYCTYPLIEGRRWRRRPAETVADEMAQLQTLGARHVYVVDSVFNSSEEHVRETCEAICRRGLDLHWSCFLRPQGLTAELMKLMARAGLSHIEFGSDSLSDRVLEEYGKKLTFDEIVESSELARRERIQFCHFLICGGPGETMETLEENFQRSRRLTDGVILAVVGMRVYPGTPLAVRARREGCVAPGSDLLAPVFYLAPGLSEPAVFSRLQEFARYAFNWIVGDPPPDYSGLVNRLRSRGVLGPLWSYFSLLQRIRGWRDPALDLKQ